MSLHLPARQAANAARASIAKPSLHLQYLLPRTQRRNAWFSGFNWGKKKAESETTPFAKALTRRDKEIKLTERLANRTQGATIFDEELKGRRGSKKRGPAEPQPTEQPAAASMAYSTSEGAHGAGPGPRPAVEGALPAQEGHADGSRRRQAIPTGAHQAIREGAHEQQRHTPHEHQEARAPLAPDCRQNSRGCHRADALQQEENRARGQVPAGGGPRYGHRRAGHGARCAEWRDPRQAEDSDQGRQDYRGPRSNAALRRPVLGYEGPLPRG
ncbi:hypothetical protein O1611_g4168 [Lasiodiplodia mahajangana]|uniref:Uncharacterized protein n=1 Tax=Lasiodiplodia mahajangana TaxID=1108764 RepID=A0ACC2JPU1_9PEZI|nr:hypothetical protein O1611_g4168 [Lasiodiplodia mahajangana]